ncbi:adenosine deaminase-like protein isoform X1 [Pararge aegeria]|uniref:Jg17676 protein n=2 Tax=Pararge aegeria TaxID=116150 RepID=A0A8S4RK19_9NEOP|nr:adenosine deaminase-like protein isoform X1 [Pararge aegeria]CAH2236163.1 jg17676 [Pararge aegeria aegeria]
MDLQTFCQELPKLELHAHLNGSLSRSTMTFIKRFLALTGMADESDVFLDEFQVGPSDTKNLSDCFQVFDIAHKLTITKETLTMATALTLREFERDGCCYIELRSTPRQTAHLTISEYIETVVQSMKSARERGLICCFIISINRNSSKEDADVIVDHAIEYHTKYPDIVVGVELSGNPAVGMFQDFVPALDKARKAGLKITLHCGEICNTQEVIEMINFKPERIGHGIYIHPKFGGNDTTWDLLRNSRIPVEICLTSNVNTKSTPDFNSHHFKEFYNANIPVVLCTDDKGVFSTSLSQEYHICGETYGIEQSKLARLSLKACNYIFAEDVRKILTEKILNFINKNEL